MKFDLVVAVDSELGIGKNNKLPWRLKTDLNYFRELTCHTAQRNKLNAVIMGRKTWESLPSKSKPLLDRLNIVVSRNKDYVLPEGVLLADSLDQALALSKKHAVSNIFVIGGAELFKESLQHTDLGHIYVTEIQQSFACDTFFPKSLSNFSLLWSSGPKNENGIEYRFKVLSSIFFGILLVLAQYVPTIAIPQPNAEKGRKVFQAMQCAICHTDGGNNLNPQKPIKGPAFNKKYPQDELIAKTVRSGIINRGMPAFNKEKLSDQDLRDLIAYIRTLSYGK
ncbi:MAG: dihydrofolate reductase [Candidatus Obscuribacterales bacterium]|nr:dihydrofolate reductase [Candidatus Obscuribacterales bacterium]